MENFQVALDGPAGSGKSSISELVAKKLGFVHIDTGAMYRAVTLEALRRGIDLADESQYTFMDDIEVVYINDKTLLNQEDVSCEIRNIEVTRNVSLVSSLKIVRDKMVYFQRLSAKNGYVLMDGRDIGTVVLKDSKFKFFLTASAEERANRRYKELTERGLEVNYDEILSEIIRRDTIDSTREVDPLRKADDAIEIDSSNYNINEVTEIICNYIENILK